jgi:hypothetical protein
MVAACLNIRSRETDFWVICLKTNITDQSEGIAIWLHECYVQAIHCGAVVHLQCIRLSTEIVHHNANCSEVRCVCLIRALHCSQLCKTKQKATVSLVVWVSHSPHRWHFESLNGIGIRTLDMGQVLEFCRCFCNLAGEGLRSLARHWQYC